MKNKSSHNSKTAVLIIWDIIIFNLCYFGAMIIRYDFEYSAIPKEITQALLHMAPIFTLLAIVIYAMLRLYKQVWEYASTREMLHVAVAVLLVIFLQFFYFRFLYEGQRLPSGYFIIEFCGLAILNMLERFMTRISSYFENEKRRAKTHKIPTLLIGAGGAGRMLLRDAQSSPQMKNEILGIVDDDPALWNKTIHSVTVYGGREKIPELVEKLGIEEIIFAIPSASHQDKKDILDTCKMTGCKLRILPGIYQLVNGEVNVTQLRDVDVNDLLGREPVNVSSNEIFDYICGRRVMVTGAGGTIGSELSRQIAKHKPKRLILLDIYENTLHDLRVELLSKYPDLNLVAYIGSIRDEKRMDNIFAKERPELVYHAAAHKHVPLMEDSPNEAIKNNVFGTLNLARLADRYQVKRFVQISTDKAVNPTSVMGASKRICEMIMQTMSRRSKTQFVCVRFGNVLGSNGSVVPLFRRQIAAGGPVTVTHPDIVRYFMTREEAVALVLQASVYAKGGEIFVLDMGEPVRIADLARNMIRLSGYVPDVDIKIIYTGLRPGEKLYEEVLMGEEGLTKTKNDRIFIGQPIDFDDDHFFAQLKGLQEVVSKEPDNIRPWIAEIVPTFKKSIDGIPMAYKDYMKKEGMKDVSFNEKEEPTQA